jgi:5-formyltetrahydrofolate cyclo-ligase
MQARRRSLPEAVRRRAGEAVTRSLLAAPELARARRVAVYAALPDELPTDTLLRALLEMGRVVLLPRTTGGNRLVFATVRDLGTLRRGRFGILEPPAGAPRAELGREDLVLVPGVAFDRRGGRLGRGSGCYDRSLPDAPFLSGLAFDFQLVETVPRAPHDRTMDAVVTESEFVRVHGERAPREVDADPG